MRTDRQVARLIVPALACVAVCIPPASWMLSACGCSCRSLLSDEGLRWLFLHLPGLLATPLTACALVWASAVGALERCARIHRHGASRTLAWVATAAALALGVLPLLAFLLPHSPLRGITGGLWPSPLLTGLPVIIPLVLLAAAMLYAYLGLYLTSPARLGLLLSWGLRRHALWILAAMLLSFIHGTVEYGWGRL